MGLTHSSTNKQHLKDLFNITKDSDNDFIVAVAGNPNTGKSTVFNCLTGLHQHTGNWPGKTVTNAQGRFTYKNRGFVLVDLPGTYSLLASSIEEIVARDFLCFGKPDACVVVADATCLERNLNLILQVSEITNKIILCLNLMDEARKNNISINIPLLSKKLGVPIVPTSARSGNGISQLKDTIYDLCSNKITPNPTEIHYNDEISSFINLISPKLDSILNKEINSRWLALRLLDGDKSILESISKYLGYNFLGNLDLGKEGGINEDYR